MKFIAIEFYNGVSNIDFKGFLRIPDNFSGTWPIGFIEYIRDNYKAENISIYPLNIHLTSDTMGKDITGYINMEDDFTKALKNLKYYRPCAFNANLRRQWSSMSPSNQDFIPKGI